MPHWSRRRCSSHATAEVRRAAGWPCIASGDAVVVPALVERGARYRLATRRDRRDRRTAPAGPLSGIKSVVPVGDAADAFVVPARVSGSIDDLEDGIALFVVERAASGVAMRGYPTQDGARAAEVTFNHAPATLLGRPDAGHSALEYAVDVGIAAMCAEAVGVMDALFAVTVEYLNTRKQFGVPIGTFQALRHRIADCKMQLELARSMSYFASLKLAEESAARRRALSQAKVQLGSSMRFVGQQCIQMHGGIGVTDEYIAGHYFKRLTCIEMSFGDTLHHLGEVSMRMADTAGVFA